MARKLIPSLFAAAVVLAALFVPWPFRSLPLPAREIFDALHLPLMLGVTLWLAWISDFRASIPKVCGLALLIELMIEVIQPLTGRSAELRDLINGLIGIALSIPILLQLRAERERLTMTLAGCFTLALFLFLAEVLPPSHAYMGFRAQFPVLSDFNDPWYKYMWHSGFDGNKGLNCQVEYEHVDGIPFVCEVTQTDISSVEFSPGPMDWSDFSVLTFDVRNPGEAFKLNLRVDDSPACKNYSCRFNYVMQVPSGRSLIKIPFTRKTAESNDHTLNLKNIIRLVLFTDEVAVGHKFHINSLRLGS